jgi:parvulin-like peptidyl-prolyl isomerase
MPLSIPARLRALVGAVAVGAVAVIASGCGPVQSGAAAIVGDRAISVNRLQTITTRVLANPSARQQLGSDVASLQRNELSRLIYFDVLDSAAKQEHVSVSQTDVRSALASLLQQVGGSKSTLEQQLAISGIAPAELNTVARAIALGNAVSNHLVANIAVTHAQLVTAYQQNIDTYDKVHSAHILVQSKAKAIQLLHEVRAHPDRFAALAKQFSIDTQSGAAGGDLGTQGPGAFVPGFSKPVFKAKPGSFILAHSQYGWHVVHVISHTTESLAKATPTLRTGILQTQASQRLTALLTATAKRLHIKVSPRYGTWNLAKQEVDPPPNDLSRPAHTPAPTTSPAVGTP